MKRHVSKHHSKLKELDCRGAQSPTPDEESQCGETRVWWREISFLKRIAKWPEAHEGGSPKL